MTIGLVGLGAVGTMYACELAKVFPKDDVLVIADEDRIARYKRDGVLANHQPLDLTYVSGDEAPVAELLIFATKHYALKEAALMAQGAIGDNTVVVSFLNGVTSEGVISELCHPQHLLYATVQGMDATRTGNDVFYDRVGSVTFGTKDGRENNDTNVLAGVLTQAGIAFDIVPDIIRRQYSKWMLNCGINQTCAYYACGYGKALEDPEASRDLLLSMEEARQCAIAEGYDLSVRERDEWIALMGKLAYDGEPSMRQDTKAGRPTEYDLFSGYVLELGRKHRIPVPVNEKFYTFLQEREKDL